MNVFSIDEVLESVFVGIDELVVARHKEGITTIYAKIEDDGVSFTLTKTNYPVTDDDVIVLIQAGHNAGSRCACTACVLGIPINVEKERESVKATLENQLCHLTYRATKRCER